ncbi:Hypothetical predicted protein [Lecanosticta acicola]|uniref:Uncharacterized protein n=1 Tax=Lecanosticta acicola TaxID=111012 RepID=A0AAI9ED62_9PEZI|nr:Hypothetical predicted protein [Lecanosticta acicola]
MLLKLHLEHLPVPFQDVAQQVGIVQVGFRLVISAASYLPQLNKIEQQQSCAGISSAHVMLNLVSMTDQFAWSFYLLAANSAVADIIVQSPPTPRDWLNLIQHAVLWTYQLLFFVLFLYYAGLHPSVKALLVLLFVILLLVEFVPIFGVVALIQRDIIGVKEWLPAFVTGIHFLVYIPLATAVGAGTFSSQWRLLNERDNVGAFSTNSSSIQSIVFLVLAFCWPSRLHLPAGANWPGRVRLVSWYQMFGWASVDGLVFAVSQGILWWQARRLGENLLQEEGQPLLVS